MELFPAQPDLSLQISPPNYRRNDEDDPFSHPNPTTTHFRHLFHGGPFHHRRRLEEENHPIRGIPVYQNPHQGLMRSRYFSRFPPKRSIRAPRMRWTTTLHARFVHAVELLGGHESNFIYFTTQLYIPPLIFLISLIYLYIRRSYAKISA